MKRHLLFAFVALICSLMANASSGSLPRHLSHSQMERILNSKPISKGSVKVAAPITGTRSAELPDTVLKGDRAEFWYYGDLLENGCGVYFLFISNMEMKRSVPLEPGQMLRVLIVGDLSEDAANPVLPTGTFNYFDEEEELPAKGSLVGADSDYLDVFVDPDNPESGDLYGYIFSLTSGSLTIAKENGVYTVSGSFHGEITDEETDELLLGRDITASYSGTPVFVDKDAYDPIEKDTVLNIPNLSGRYMDGGEWSMAFYSVELDEDGFIIGAGDLFNVEACTKYDDPDVMNFDNLVGTYSGGDLFAGISPYQYGYGVWYDFYGMHIAIGTNLTTYDKNANVDKTGLATSGTMKVSKVSEKVYHFDFDFTTPEGKKLTGSWEGDPSGLIQDQSSLAGVKDIVLDGAQVKVAKGHLEAPADALIFNAAGQRVSSGNVPAGIYIVKANGKSVKVAVK